MGEDTLDHGRRSTRLSISIPVIISGVDADGNELRESVRTLIVNKHGGKIATTRHLALNTEITVENLALSVMAKANVVWLSDKHHAGDLHHVGLQLIEAQNVWGIAFPPDDWSVEAHDEAPAAPDEEPVSEPADASPDAQISSLAGEEITIRMLQELQQSADAHVQEFKDRLKHLAQHVGLELEIDLRECAASVRTREVASLEEEIARLRESLCISRKEMAELQGRIQEMKSAVPSPAENPSPAASLQEARRQLSAMANSVVERMNSAAVAGLNEYRSLLQKENRESAERLRRGTDPPPGGKSPNG